MPAAILQYPEWKPDLTTNPEEASFTQAPFLSICRGVLPRENFYEQLPLPQVAAYAVPDPVVGAFARTRAFSDPSLRAFAGTEDAIYYDSGSAWTATTIVPDAPNHDIESWRFTSTNALASGALAAASSPGEIGDSRHYNLLISNYAGTSWDSVGGDEPPVAAVVAMVGEFAVAGNGFTQGNDPTDPYTNIFAFGIRWSAIGNVDDWPEVNSADQLAKQAGMQTFPDSYGEVTYIAPLSPLSALVFQKRAIHRMSYIGGDVVWQFDTLRTDIGAETRHGNVQAGGWTYFVNRTGFYRTDGQSIEPIGAAKVNRYFLANVDWTQPLLICAAFDEVRSCVFWSFADTTDPENFITNLLIFNYAIGRWSLIDLTSSNKLEFLYPYGSGNDTPFTPVGFSIGERTVTYDDPDDTFAGVLRTGEENLNPGGLATIQGIRPLCDDLTGQPTILIKSRMLLSQDLVSTATTRNTRTGIHNARVTGRYHAVEMSVGSGEATRISGLEVLFETAGMY